MRVHKIVSVSVVILLVTVLLAGAVTVPAAAQYDWMQYQYNAAHTGDYSPVAGTVPSNGQLKWTYTTGGDVFGSSPAVVNGVVYIVGSSNVYALNANNGQKLWTYAAETGGFASAWNGASPAVVNVVVYVGSNDGNVYALNANNGHKLWNYTIGGASSSPAVANGVVYVTSLEGALNIYALNANNGHKLWNYSSGNRVFVPGLLSTPAVANGVVYVGGSDGNLYALNANNGHKLWNVTTGSYSFSAPAVANGVVYVGGEGNPPRWLESTYTHPYKLYAFHANNGAMLWSFDPALNIDPQLQRYVLAPAVANGVVYVNFAYPLMNLGGIYALDARTGATLWNQPYPSIDVQPPVYANGVVYLGVDNYITTTASGSVYALNANNGAQLWNYPIIYSSPAVVSGVVYMGSGGSVYAIGNRTTTLSASASPTASVNTHFTIDGTLSGSTTGIPGATVTLQSSTNNAAWKNVATTTTNAVGGYQFTTSESTARTYYFRTTYAGNALYAGNTSRSVSVKVVVR